MIFTATFSDLQVPQNITQWLIRRRARASRLVIVTSPSSVYEAGNIPHDPHRDRRRRIMRRRSLDSLFSSLINYKEVDRLQLGTIITISLRTSSKKSATSAAA